MENFKHKDTYACVYFIQDGTYSYVKSKYIAYDTVEFPDAQCLVGKTLAVVWEETGDEFQAEIIAIGRKKAMSNLAADRAQEAANQSFEVKQNEYGRGKREKRKPLIQDSFDINAEGSHIAEPKKKRKARAQGNNDLSRQAEDTIRGLVESTFLEMPSEAPTNDFASPNGSQAPPNMDLENAMAEKDKEIRSLKRKPRDLSNRVLNNEKAHASTGDLDKEKIVTVGTLHKVDVPRGIVDCIKDRYRLRPQQFLIAMMELTGLFTLDEIASSSVYGKKTSTSPEYVRPALGPKFLAVKEFTVAECGLVPNTIALAKFEEGARRVCVDARKRIKQQKSNAENGFCI